MKRKTEMSKKSISVKIEKLKVNFSMTLLH